MVDGPKLLGAALAAAAVVAGVIVWQSTRDPAGEQHSRVVREPDPPPPPSGSETAGRTAVQQPGGESRAPTEEDVAAALATSLVRGQIELAPGTSAPESFELWVEAEGSVPKVFVFPGDQRRVSFDLEPGRSVISARAEGLGSRLLIAERSSDAPPPPFRLVLEPASRLAGQVLDARGAPLAELPVYLAAAGEPGVRTAQADQQGRYEFTNVPAGSYQVAFGSARHPIAPPAPVDVSASEVRDAPTRSMPDLGEAEITVVDRAGSPVAGARVEGPGQLGGAIEGTSDVQGLVRARFLPAGPYFVEVATPDGRRAQSSLQVEAGRIGRALVRLPE